MRWFIFAAFHSRRENIINFFFLLLFFWGARRLGALTGLMNAGRVRVQIGAGLGWRVRVQGRGSWSRLAKYKMLTN